MQHSARAQRIVTLAVLAAEISFEINDPNQRWQIVAIVLAWVGEDMNTAFEHLCDVFLSVSCLGAGAVLIHFGCSGNRRLSV